MTFDSPQYLFLLVLLVPYAVWYFLLRRRHEAAVRTASLEAFRRPVRTWRTAFLHLPFALRLLTLALLVVVLARPQTANSLHEREKEGIDIMLAMDISTSMLTPDLPPSRLEVAKLAGNEFIAAREDDNIGLTLFGGEAYTQCPLTSDHAALSQMLAAASCELPQRGIIAPGTAIGMGIASAVTHLAKSRAKSRVVVMLTDGVNNAGEISPLMAADMAAEAGIRVYTIAVGKSGRTRQAVATLPNGETYEADLDNAMDATTLQEIARRTGGTFYRAESRRSLSEIYRDIDQLEKTKFRALTYNRRYEAFSPFAAAALLTLLLEVVLRLTAFRRIP